MKFLHYDEQCMTRYILSQQSQMAAVMIEKWGMVAGIEDGEDSAGRAKFRLATPEELVARAFKVAELFAAQCDAEDHLRDLGPMEGRRFLQAQFGEMRLMEINTMTLKEENAIRDAKREALKKQ